MEGHSDSFASFSVLPDYVTGMIILANETFWLEAKDPSEPLALFIYKTSDVWFHPSVREMRRGQAEEQQGAIINKRVSPTLFFFIICLFCFV